MSGHFSDADLISLFQSNERLQTIIDAEQRGWNSVQGFCFFSVEKQRQKFGKLSSENLRPFVIFHFYFRSPFYFFPEFFVVSRRRGVAHLAVAGEKNVTVISFMNIHEFFCCLMSRVKSPFYFGRPQRRFDFSTISHL